MLMFRAVREAIWLAGIVGAGVIYTLWIMTVQTTDNGESWSAQRNPPSSVPSIEEIEPNTHWVFGSENHERLNMSRVQGIYQTETTPSTIDTIMSSTIHEVNPVTHPPVRAATICLTSVRRSSELLAALESIMRYIPFSQVYPTILVHEGDYNSFAAKKALLNRWNDRILNLRQAPDTLDGEEESHADRTILANKMEAFSEQFEFLAIDMNAPEELKDLLSDETKEVVDYGRWPGYHAMCRFFAVEIFSHPRLRHLDYYMRFDTDSFFTTPQCADPFLRMQAKKLSYSSRHLGADPGYVVLGMWNFTENFANHHPKALATAERNRLLPAPALEGKDMRGVPGWYNNYEVVHIPSFLRDDVQEWIRAIAAYPLGFFQFRWGDSPLRFMTTAMFFEKDETEVRCDFGYYHQGLSDKSCECEPLAGTEYPYR